MKFASDEEVAMVKNLWSMFNKLHRSIEEFRCDLSALSDKIDPHWNLRGEDGKISGGGSYCDCRGCEKGWGCSADFKMPTAEEE